MSQGLLISFDGTDSSGKETQTGQLTNHLRARNKIVRNFQTPDYNTDTGRRLKQLFQGQLGPLTWQEKMQLFAANRAEHKNEVAETLASGGVVIYDRYVPSSLAFIVIESSSPSQVAGKRAEIQAAVALEEYSKHQMPREDLSIFLDVPPRLAADLLAQRQAQTNDQAEYTDALALQERLYQEYVLLCESDPAHYIRIPCVGAHDNLRSITEISESVWQAVTLKFPQLEKPL